MSSGLLYHASLGVSWRGGTTWRSRPWWPKVWPSRLTVGPKVKGWHGSKRSWLLPRWAETRWDECPCRWMPRRVGVSASKRAAWPGIKRWTLYWKTRRWPVNKCSCPHTSPRGTSLALNESTFCKESAVNDWMIFASDFRWVRIFVPLQEFRSVSFSPGSWLSWF